MVKFRDPILAVDFAGMYRWLWDRSSFPERRASDWDRRALEHPEVGSLGDYEQQVLAQIDLRGAKTVLDIGCGSGNLAVPLARQVERLYALDFSKQMLALLKRYARQEGIDNIRTFCLSWSDSWRRVPRTDVVLCSRAMGVRDLRAALWKMSSRATQRCYATVPVSGNFLSTEVAQLLDRRIIPRPGYIYAVNLLYQMGFRAEVRFIRTRGGRTYGAFEDFLKGIEWRIGALTLTEIKRLKKLYARLPADAEGHRILPHDFDWALLSWETKK